MNTKDIAIVVVFASLYFVLTTVFHPISFLAIQVRFWFIKKEDFNEKILKHTLLPYLNYSTDLLKTL